MFANLFIQAEVVAARAREVQRSADQLRLLTETAPIGIFQTDAHNRYVYTNARWTEITGIPSADGGRPGVARVHRRRAARRSRPSSSTSLDKTEFSSRLEMPIPGSAPRSCC